MVLYPINGLNARMGSLFKTPKHLLLVDGEPALKKSINYMKRFGDISILAGEKYYDEIRIDWLPESARVFKVEPTNNVIETIKQTKHGNEELWIVDCDIVPRYVNRPHGDTVYCFNNSGSNQYSNFKLDDGKVVACNEKGEKYQYAGAGIYYFRELKDFLDFSDGCTSVSQVYASMLQSRRTIYADTTSDIFRLGTLPDITGGFTDNKLERTITKTGKTVLSEVRWYDHYQDKRDIPKILSFSPESMTMEYIERDADLNIYSVSEMIEKYRMYKPINTLPFEAYIDRIKYHLYNNTITGGSKLLNKLAEIDLPPTFSHGDLSLINIIPTSKGMKLIDPLYGDNFGNYLLDYAKLLFSLKFFNNDVANFHLLNDLVKAPIMPVMIASESVRVATYNKKFNFIAENLINEL